MLVYSSIISIIFYHYTVIKFKLPDRIDCDVGPIEDSWLSPITNWETTSAFRRPFGDPIEGQKRVQTIVGNLDITLKSEEALRGKEEEKNSEAPDCNLRWDDQDYRPCSPVVFKPFVTPSTSTVVDQSGKPSVQDLTELTSKGHTGVVIWKTAHTKQTYLSLNTFCLALVVSVLVLVPLISKFAATQAFPEEDGGHIRQRSEGTQTVTLRDLGIPKPRRTIPIPRFSTPRTLPVEQESYRDQSYRFRGDFVPGRHLLSRDQTSVSPSTFTTKGVQVRGKPKLKK